MKSYIKGIITGFLISAMVFAIPAVAENIDALFNQVRINVNGVDEIQWGENIELDNGETTPSSILYNGTTYLPMRKLGELSGNKIYWNGDSRTVSMTGSQKDVKVVAEKPDKNGNMWTYYTFKVREFNFFDLRYYDIPYLGVIDKQRGYERVYCMASEHVNVVDDAIYFTHLYRERENSYDVNYNKVDVVKLTFSNDVNTQDGEVISEFMSDTDVIFDGEYLFYSLYPDKEYSRITAYNYLTGEEFYYTEKWTRVYNLKQKENDENKLVLSYRMGTTLFAYNCEIAFNKDTKVFENRIAIEDK